MEIENAIKDFNRLLHEYPLFDTYVSVGTTVNAIVEDDGFDIVINNNHVFHVGMWELDQMRTYVYCTMSILREIWLGCMSVTE